MMKRIIGAGLLLGWSIAAPGAQQTATNEPAHKIFVLTGCLEGGDATPLFKLTGSAAIGQAPPASPSEVAGRIDGSSARAYLLQPISSIAEQGVRLEQLQSHLGKRVEVTVRPAELAAPSTSSTSSKPDEPAPQRYTVIKIARVADSCD